MTERPGASAPRRIIVTRPRAQCGGWVDALQALGQPASALPLIAIAGIADTAPLVAAWQTISDRALVIFVSGNAVEHFFAAAPAGRRWPAGVIAGSTGPGTSAALRAAGVDEAALVGPAPDAPANDSEALWARLAGRDWSGRRVLVVRGEDGRDWLAAELRSRGAVVDFVAAYRRLPPAPTTDEAALLAAAIEEPGRHLWLFSSSEAVGNLRRLAPGADWSRAAALATHPRIVQATIDAGFGRVELAPPAIAAVAGLAAGLAAEPGAEPRADRPPA